MNHHSLRLFLFCTLASSICCASANEEAVFDLCICACVWFFLFCFGPTAVDGRWPLAHLSAPVQHTVWLFACVWGHRVHRRFGNTTEKSYELVEGRGFEETELVRS